MNDRAASGPGMCHNTQRPRRKWLVWLVAVGSLPILVVVFGYVLPTQPRIALTPPQPEEMTSGPSTHLNRFSPDGRLLVTTGDSKWKWAHLGPIRVWEVDTGRERFAVAHDWAEITAVQFSPDGRFFAAANIAHHLKLWDAATGEECADLDLEGQTHFILNFCFSSDSRLIVFGCYGPKPGDPDLLKFWDVARRRPCGEVEGDVRTLRFAPDGKTFAVGCHRERIIDRVCLWQLAEDGQSLLLLKEHNAEANYLAFSPDLRTFATVNYLCGEDQPPLIELRDTSSGAVLAQAYDPDEVTSMETIRFSEDGRLLIANGVEERRPRRLVGRKIIWRVDTDLQEKTTWDASTYLSGDNRLAAVPDQSGASVWDAVTGSFLGELNVPGDSSFSLRMGGGASENIYSGPKVVFSPDTRVALVDDLMCPSMSATFEILLAGRYQDALSGGHGLVTRLWQVETGEHLATIPSSWEAMFSPDGRTLATLNRDGTVNLWDVPPRKPLLLILGISLVTWVLLLIVGRFVWRG